ncbi:MAG: hypothetical protein EHM57_04715 [Actinobacteria bacterium]|nr:MAG: hypothetical protein EHM57_04715 [Actinomycetota bacterium]
MHDLDAAFEATFGRPPTLVVEAPGRVNVVGEHTDYSSLPVLPMAVQLRVGVAAAPRDDAAVEAVSLSEAGAYRSTDGRTPPWGRYVASAVRALGPGPGASLLVGGDLPGSGGLSSSSALTLAVIAAVGRVRRRDVAASELIATAVAAERGVGVEGGTMDQTVIVHARAGHALRIDFAPAGLRHVAVPEAVAFVAGYSGVPAAKGEAAGDGYNARVVGCRCAAAVLAARAGRRIAEPLLGLVPDLDPGDLPESATPRAAAAIAGCDPAALVRLTVGRFDADRALPLRAFARHVLSEARRVDAAESALLAGDGRALGAILDASHHSLAVDFGVSTPGLDRLVEVARLAGAHGARRTGAGFGGWAIAVTDRAGAPAVAEIMAAVGGLSFVAVPSAGMR